MWQVGNIRICDMVTYYVIKFQAILLTEIFLSSHYTVFESVGTYIVSELKEILFVAEQRGFIT